MQTPRARLASVALLWVGLELMGACGSSKVAGPRDQTGAEAVDAGPTTGSEMSPDGSTVTSSGDAAANGGASDTSWGDGAAVVGVAFSAINKQPLAWYASAGAETLADNILYYQNADGGWPKNVDMTTRTAPRDKSTIDNAATTTQLIYLSLVYSATQKPAYRDAFLKGLDAVLAAQYPTNGGWPQNLTMSSGYQKHITFNDNAIVRVLNLLRDIVNKAARAQYAFVDDERAAKCEAAVQLGIECILKTQIVVDGVKTGWCAQHDEVTLLPANARSYELSSNSGLEGSAILQFLMTIDRPSPAIVEAVQSAAAWFHKVQIKGLRVMDIADASQMSGTDTVVVADAAAGPIWARFYEVGTDVPFFCGRDGIKKQTLAEIENERRVGYSWYGNWPADVLRTYASWQPTWAPDRNVLAPSAATGVTEIRGGGALGQDSVRFPASP